MPTLGPRLVIAGTQSGVGKTTVATGLLAALRGRGTRVGAAKVGPDYIDPGYHALASGRPGRNLDPWMCGVAAMAPLAARAGEGTDVLVIEGVMGLFDGAADGSPSSTAWVAAHLRAPVILVVDASSLSRSVAALVHGYATWDPAVEVAGVIVNRVGSPAHETMLREALEEVRVPVVGALHRDDRLAWRDRHLGLVPVAEEPGAVAEALGRLASAITAGCDLEAITAIARRAPPLSTAAPVQARPSGRARIAVAAGPAFSFSYQDNLELLAQAGAELVAFDPLREPVLPDGISGLIAGGGFPEVYAEQLGDNRPLLCELGARMAGGLVTWAECGGLLWLARSLDGRPLVGAVPARGTMTDRLTLGYREVFVRRDNPLAAAGQHLRGHEFHYSTVEPPGNALELRSRFASCTAGWATPTLLASYLHVHLTGQPWAAERFVASADPRTGQHPGR